MNTKTTYFLLLLTILLGVKIANARKLPKEFVELNANIGFGSKINQMNAYYGGNFSLYNHSRFYFTAGTRLNATHNLREMAFSMPQASAPVLTYSDVGLWIYSLNLTFGVSCAISENFYASLNAEVLGISVMSPLNGNITNNGTSSSFSNQPTATNICSILPTLATRKIS